MNKPKFWYYPIIDIFEVSKYLSELYDEDIDVLDILFGGEVYNDTYVSYLVEEPEEEYSETLTKRKKNGKDERKLRLICLMNFLIGIMFYLRFVGNQGDLNGYSIS